VPSTSISLLPLQNPSGPILSDDERMRRVWCLDAGRIWIQGWGLAPTVVHNPAGPTALLRAVETNELSRYCTNSHTSGSRRAPTSRIRTDRPRRRCRCARRSDRCRRSLPILTCRKRFFRCVLAPLLAVLLVRLLESGFEFVRISMIPAQFGHIVSEIEARVVVIECCLGVSCIVAFATEYSSDRTQSCDRVSEDLETLL